MKEAEITGAANSAMVSIQNIAAAIEYHDLPDGGRQYRTGVGTIKSVGAGVNVLEENDVVIYFSKDPIAMAQNVQISSEYVFKIPAKLSPKTAVANFTKAIAAKIFCTNLYAVRPGSNILIMNGEIPESKMLCFFAKKLGAKKVIGVVKRSGASGLPYDLTINADNRSDWSQEVMQVTNGMGIQCSYMYGDGEIESAVRCMDLGGLIAILDGGKPNNKIDLNILREKSLFLSTPLLSQYFFTSRLKKVELIDIVQMIAEGGAAYQYEEFAYSKENVDKALQYVSNEQRGKAPIIVF